MYNYCYKIFGELPMMVYIILCVLTLTNLYSPTFLLFKWLLIDNKSTHENRKVVKVVFVLFVRKV